MSEFTPLSTKAEADLLDMDDCVAGYMYGWAGGLEEPGSDRSKSFWHGWRNSMMDKGKMPFDAAATQLVKEVVRQSN